jgi:hypothetical protein
MNIIFLDIDGVLRTHESDCYWSQKLGEPIPYMYKRHFSPDALENLNYIVLLTGAKIIVTSTWRLFYTLTELKSLFRERGFKGDIIGVTGVCDTRGEEIVEWLNDHKIDNFVVLDDNIKDIVNRIPFVKVVKCESTKGINEDVFEKVIDILG